MTIGRIILVRIQEHLNILLHRRISTKEYLQYPIKKIARHIAVNRSISLFIAVMSSQRCREIAIKTTVANATRIQRLSDDFPTVTLRFFSIGYNIYEKESVLSHR